MIPAGHRAPEAWPIRAAIAGFVVFAAFLVRDAVGVPSIAWMNHYAPQDFPTPRSLVDLLWNTRLPLPPLLTAAEILNFQFDGTTGLVTAWLYRFCLVASYALALWLARRCVAQFAVALALSVVFLWATTVIHPAGAWVYDLLLPTLLLGFVACLRLAGGVERAWPAFLAGLFLSLAELTRPYMVLLLPLLAGGALVRLWQAPRRLRIAFVLPLVALSGAWHLHQFASHGQIAWSNHGGFNLLNAWPMVGVPDLVPESQEPAAAGRYWQLDTQAHSENNRRAASAVLGFVMANPLRALVHAAERVGILVSAPVAYMRSDPRHWILPLYRVAARYAAVYALLAASCIVLAALWRPRAAPRLLARTDNLLLLTAALSLLVVAIADHGEEARFLLMLLPLLAAAPWPRLGLPVRPRRATLAAAVAAVCVVPAIEIVARGAERLPAGPQQGAFARPPAASAAPARLRVLALNIRGRHWRDAERAAAAVKHCLDGVHLAGLNEVAGAAWSGGAHQAAALAADTGLAAAHAASERRWWREQLGHAVLTNLPAGAWRSILLPRRLAAGHQSMMLAELDWGGRRLSVLVTQLAGADADIQLPEAIALFRELPPPAILMGGLVKLGDWPALAALRREPGVAAAVDDAPRPGRIPPGNWLLARGFRAAAEARCDGVEPGQPGLILELEPLP
ncbi:MAG: hypothetical protein IT562_15925 [Alphaproteobacteria bacterium]|nr:hypothetical protein [Alphaproteobacteria bacterium]